MAEYKVVKVPKDGAKITMGANKQLQVPDNPIIPFIEGDGTGRDIWRASVRVFDAAVEKAYKGKKKIRWMEVYAGEKSFKQYNSWLHEETVPRSGISRRHQRSADDAHRRRHDVTQRRSAQAARSVRLPTAGAVFQRRAFAGEAS